MSGLISHRKFKLQDTPDLTGKTAVVTGGQAGIGREITAQLLLHGIAKVYVLARSEERFTAARSEWVNQKGLKAADVENRTEFVQCDLSDIHAVKRSVEILRSRLNRLDILFNNAGVPPSSGCSLSPQGIESVFATNHVGHYVLTLLLLPLIESTGAEYGSARIVITSSSLHLACQELDLALLRSDQPVKSPAVFDNVWRYGRSKLANILFTRELAKLLEKKGSSNVFVNSYFPGNIPTEAMDTWKNMLGSIAGKVIKSGVEFVGQSPEDGAATAIFLAASPEVEKQQLRGKYFVPVATEYETSTTAQNKDLAKNLWYWTDHQVSEALGKSWQEPA
ncbi:short chain dehydrogenase/reductase [Pseudovirgaria hyperparasitica]|uniref:Short chain dehydrogenase/reductase n=1 Tax=Pseudovirgaria hyperparasitica TaxID=470096 RepID=A0A6A6WL47_9PEZI|nr:short chain dehydrogenase/reductase [Pseudovirgaria hyperparasitica]KAF2762892.1 short chain dehydrogenase/reductase [Pseudovirgaria hyperparasitica]